MARIFVSLHIIFFVSLLIIFGIVERFKQWFFNDGTTTCTIKALIVHVVVHITITMHEIDKSIIPFI